MLLACPPFVKHTYKHIMEPITTPAQPTSLTAAESESLQNELQQAIAKQEELQCQVVGTESMLARLRREKEQVEQELAATQAHARNLGAMLAQQHAKYAELLQSHSWRLTRPLRGLVKGGRQLRTLIPQMAAHVLQGKGEAPAAGTAAHARRPPSEYEQWLDRYDHLDEQKRQIIHNDLADWREPPRLSLLMPVYNTPETCLRRAIDSVLSQLYPHWELCIADDASTEAHVAPLLADYASRDARIKLVTRPRNGHIAAASNSALALATGDFICLLDHDDVIVPHALYMVASAIRAHPSADLFYSDEDKIDNDNRRFDPYFKPDWNPDLFLSYNFFNHLGAFRASLMRELGGFRVGYEGSEDYDLVLRAVARVGHAKVRHIPHVLYSWGVIPGSAAASHNEKPYALQAAIRSVSDYLQSQQIAAQVEESAPGSGTLRVRYALPDPAPLVSIIIPTRDGYALLRQCIDSLYAKTRYPNFEILVVDNGSEDPQVLSYMHDLVQAGRIRVLRDERPFNYSALNNAAAREAKGQLLCLMNNDIEVISPDWLDEMVSQALRPEIGMVGCRLWYPDDTLQHAGVILGIGGVAGNAHHKLNRSQAGYFSRAQLVQNYSAITAACAVVRTAVFWEVEGLNERQLAVAFNDVDLCLRIRDAGYRNLWTPYAELYHHESASRGLEDNPEKQARFAREIGYMVCRYGDGLLFDPAYNPNLALLKQDYTLAYPPRLDMLAVDGAAQRS